MGLFSKTKTLLEQALVEATDLGPIELCLDGIAQESQLQAATHLLSQCDYADVVMERTIVNLCGYPLFNNKLPECQKKGWYKISLKEHKVYDVQEMWLYCFPKCLIRSCTFIEGLEPDRTTVVNQYKISMILDTFEALLLDNDDARNDGEQPMAVVPDIGYHEEQESGAKAELKEPGILPRLVIHGQENGHGQGISLFDYAGPSDVIEGYVPQRDCWRSPLVEALSRLSVHSSSKKGSKKTKCSPKRETLKSESDFTSSIIVGEPCAQVILNSATSSNSSIEQLPNQRGQISEGSLDLLYENKPQIPKLKSSLKTRGKKQFNRNITWAAEKQFELGSCLEVLELGNIDNSEETLTCISPGVESISQSNIYVKDAESLESIKAEVNQESINDARLESAEALAMALTEAAVAVESGETDASEAA